ncbi:zinc-dependent alcohol dehydrogenase [Pseudonocardia sp. TRM90224]|uniref:zinc-dependent alcohol dehydrogenase n=1 Tax=Pseudonocardia sp. TRM90224 TaxID=2812678 RepID=UPI001E5D7A08|nr:alcohol dehydrogenase catalytic domain-containing protein [Pseudonocardia sp. TRM90224]
MQVLVWNGPWDLTVETKPDPVAAAGEVLVTVAATGICGSDVHGFTGENGRRHPGQVMGHETVGRVAGVGEGVVGFTEGDVVTVNPLIACGACTACAAGAEQSCARRRVIGVHPEIVAAFAETMAVPATNVVALPAGLPLEYGALVEPLSVGYHAARRGGCGPDDRVLVIGGGPIGQACILAARRLGAHAVAVTEPAEHRRELAGSLGATAHAPDGDVAGALGGPATLVLDAVGSTASIAGAVAHSALGARIVLVGMNAPRIDLPAYAVSTEERTLIGSFCYSAQEFRETAQWVGTRPAGLERLVDGRVDMAGAPGAFTSLADGSALNSKVLVYPHGVPDIDR